MTDTSAPGTDYIQEQQGRNQIDDHLPDLISVQLEQIKCKAQKLFENAKGSHDWEHTLRVYRMCERIGKAEGADMAVVRPAAYLHDIGRICQDQSSGKICHANEGAKIAQRMIQILPLSDLQKDNIVHCIRTHRFRNNQRPETIEAKVVFDADKLDSIGAVGVARAFLFAGEVGATLHNPDIQVEKSLPYSRDDTGYREFTLKLRLIKDRIMTREGRKIAGERHEFMANFFKRFLEEYEGKR
ncbi:MAG: HD domain-containing protein [Desulfobacterales bacterium]